MAKKKKLEPEPPIEIHQPIVEMIPINLLELNPDNPKKPMSKDRLKGLNRSLTEFGLRDMIKVAPHPEIEGSYLVLDGNTRIEELRKRTDENIKIPCLVHADLTTREKIAEFVLTFDRNVKAYDEMAVFGQLRDLVEAGEDTGMLSELVNLPDLQKYIEIINMPIDETLTRGSDLASIIQQDSIIISGPKIDIDAIRRTLKGIKGKMRQHQRVEKAIQEAEELDWSDEKILFVVLDILARLKEMEMDLNL
jgi:ParB family chromosome partitioning protein